MATFLVTEQAATGAGSLAAAIAAAEGSAGPDTIVFASDITRIVTSGTLTINSNLVIDGDRNDDGVADVTLSSDIDSDGTGNHTLFQLGTGANATFDGLVFTKGYGSGSPTTAAVGAILNHGTVTIRNSQFLDNRAVGWAGLPGSIGTSGSTTGRDGTDGGVAAGAILNRGIMSVENTRFADNVGLGGNGGVGGNGYSPTSPFGSAGAGGDGGDGGFGAGAIVNFTAATLVLSGVVLDNNSGRAGNGGNGGNKGQGGFILGGGGVGGIGAHGSASILDFGVISGNAAVNGGSFSGGIGGVFGNDPPVDNDDTPFVRPDGFGGLQPTRIGTGGNDTRSGFAASEFFGGLAGDDTFLASGGNDTFNGGLGSDTIDFSNITAGVAFNLSSTAAQFIGVGNLTVTGVEHAIGGSGNDELVGTGGANTLRGRGGDDTLNSAGGGDLLVGGTGNDFYHVNGNDAVEELANEGFDTVNAFESFVLSAGVHVERLQLNDPGSTVSRNLTGNEFGQIIVGNAGINTLSGGAGNDTLDGGAGGDLLDGGTGDDTFYVDSNSDRVRDNAGEGFDTVLVSRFDFTLFASAEIEVLGTTNDAGTSDIDLTGNSFAQTLIGNAGDNRLDGKAGADVLRGLDGDDVLIGGTASAGASNQLFGDNGSDTASYSGIAGAVYADLRPGGAGYIGGVLTDILHSIENLTGGSGADVLVGDEGSNVLGGGGGSDQLYGFGGNDILLGGAAGAGTYNILFGGEGSDTASYQGTVTALYVELRSPAGYLNVGGSYVLVDVMDSVENAIGGSGNDLLVGTEGANLLDGGAGTDNLYGFGGDDILVGGSAAAGQYNVLVGGAGTDTASYAGTTAAVYADLAISAGYVTAGGALVLTDILLEMEGLAGGSGADTLLGDGGANRIAGGAGADVLYGRGGADTFAFATVADSRISTGADTIVDFQTGFDKVDLSALGIGFGQVLLANASSSMALYADTDTTAAGYEFVVSFVGANAISISDIVF